MSKQLPIRRNNFKTQEFLAYLAANGCEIGKPSNPYEVVRYRAYWKDGKKPITHIVYSKENGLLTWMNGSQGHYHSFLQDVPMARNNPPFVSQFDGRQPKGETIKAKSKRPASKAEITRKKLLERDGPDCWFCGEVMGDDCTIEHLVPKSKGGRNTLANYALAHQSCNAKAADLPLVDKIALRAKLHGATA